MHEAHFREAILICIIVCFDIVDKLNLSMYDKRNLLIINKYESYGIKIYCSRSARAQL
jgi:hypothetical protein